MESTSLPAGVAELKAEPGRGAPAGTPERHAEPAKLAAAVGQGLRRLHAVPVTPQPSVSSGPEAWQAMVDRCRARVESGAVDGYAFPPPYDRYTPSELVEMLARTELTWSPDDAPVWCHGAPVPDRVLVDGGQFVGFDDLSTVLVADRHLDLAVAHLGVAAALGAEAVFGMYEGYGTDPNLLRLDHYILAVHLLGILGS